MRGLDPRIHGAAWAVFAGWAVAPATALSLPQSRAVPRRATVLPSGPQRRATVSTWLPREIEAKRGALQQVLRPIAEAGGLPNETYTSERFAAVERDAVLARTWPCIGAGARVPQPGERRRSVVEGQSVEGSVESGGGGLIKK